MKSLDSSFFTLHTYCLQTSYRLYPLSSRFLLFLIRKLNPFRDNWHAEQDLKAGFEPRSVWAECWLFQAVVSGQWLWPFSHFCNWSRLCGFDDVKSPVVPLRDAVSSWWPGVVVRSMNPMAAARNPTTIGYRLLSRSKNLVQNCGCCPGPVFALLSGWVKSNDRQPSAPAWMLRSFYLPIGAAFLEIIFHVYSFIFSFVINHPLMWDTFKKKRWEASTPQRWHLCELVLRMTSVISARHAPSFIFMTMRFAKVKLSELCCRVIIGVKVMV